MGKNSVSITANTTSVSPTFSIIIPHKDIPDLLMRCLRSIPVSEDIQVIVVDDNSADADTYLDKYPELSRPYLEFVRTTKGGGAGYARNVGLDRAKGKWLLFADADDFFCEHAFEVIKEYEESDADVIFFKIKSVYSDDINQSAEKRLWINKLIDNYLNFGDDIAVRAKHCVPWGKMIKRKFIFEKQFRFDEIKYSNDVYFSTCVGLDAAKILADSRILYGCTTREGSLTNNFLKKDEELRIRAEAVFRRQKLLKERQIILKPMPFRLFLMSMLLHDKMLFRKYIKRVDEIYPSTYSAIKDLCLSRRLHIKIYIWFYSYFLRIF